MATSRSYFARSKNYRFLPTDHKITNDSTTFELDESEIWNSTAARSQSPDYRKPNSRISRNTAAERGGVIGSASLPVNVPDWSKILKDEYRENRRRDGDGGDDYDCGGDGSIIPPHEYLARSRMASLSVQEGKGRTLKGRDLSRVRNAIWLKTGFQD